jgi:hypothetical protein
MVQMENWCQWHCAEKCCRINVYNFMSWMSYGRNWRIMMKQITTIMSIHLFEGSNVHLLTCNPLLKSETAAYRLFF